MRDFFTGFFALIVATILFFVVLAVASYFTLGYFIRGEEVIAPEVTARTVTEALEILKSKKLIIELDGSEPSETLDSGMILRQRPRAGTRVKAHSPVRVVISTGPRLVFIPHNLVGLSQAEAGIELRRLGMDLGNVTYLEAPGKQPDSVLASDPPVGAGLLPGTHINLLLASASPGAMVKTPNLYGLTAEQAREECRRYGLKLELTGTAEDASAAPGNVEQQNPAPGTPARSGQKITVSLR